MMSQFTPEMWDCLEDIARGDGPEQYISEGWIDAADAALEGRTDIQETILKAYAAYEAWKSAAKDLRAAAEVLVAQGNTVSS
jgi:hypothetical protein